jgi:hypothetical protein
LHPSRAIQYAKKSSLSGVFFGLRRIFFFRPARENSRLPAKAIRRDTLPRRVKCGKSS